MRYDAETVPTSPDTIEEHVEENYDIEIDVETIEAPEYNHLDGFEPDSAYRVENGEVDFIVAMDYDPEMQSQTGEENSVGSRAIFDYDMSGFYIETDGISRRNTPELIGERAEDYFPEEEQFQLFSEE